MQLFYKVIWKELISLREGDVTGLTYADIHHRRSVESILSIDQTMDSSIDFHSSVSNHSAQLLTTNPLLAK